MSQILSQLQQELVRKQENLISSNNKEGPSLKIWATD